MPDEELKVQVAAWGPDQRTVEAAGRALLNDASVQALLKDTQHRLLSVDLLDPERKVSRPTPPTSCRATIYDYTNDRTILVDGPLSSPKATDVVDSALEPLPSQEEFAAAVEIVTKHEELGPLVRAQRLRPYRPMPPLVPTELPDGRSERVVAVGLLPVEGERQHEIVGVNMKSQSVVRYENRAPVTAQAHNPICGQPYANPQTARNVPGQVWVTVTQGGTVLWRFLVVRPAASSGTNGSGVELRFVDYRGKRVLYRAHVPILNVRYEANACGPYRDWQNQEIQLQAAGNNVAPGFLLCPTPAKTILDNGVDGGAFLGVAIYVQGQEVVLVSQMEAGWYRYISQWRLHADGTIRPRFGFSATQNSCVCHVHYHHAYWRLDFDIRTAGNNVVSEFNDPPLFPPSNWHDKHYEIMRFRDPGHQRHWRVRNSATNEAYDIIPGPDDGVATASPDWPFPRGDFWVLRYHPTEIDDGVIATGPPYEAGIDNFKNGELVYNQDVVVWYGAHFKHDVSAEPPGTFGDIVGPELKPVNW